MRSAMMVCGVCDRPMLHQVKTTWKNASRRERPGIVFTAVCSGCSGVLVMGFMTQNAIEGALHR